MPKPPPRGLVSPEKLRWALLSAVLPAGMSGDALAQPRPAQIAMRPPEPPPRADEPPDGSPVMEVATDPEHPFRPPRPRQYEGRMHAGCGSRGGGRARGGLKLSGGRALNDRDSKGYYLRIEPELVMSRKNHASGVFAVVPLSVEMWLGSGAGNTGSAGGFGLPVVFQFGLGSPHLFATMGGGFEWLIIDKVESTGVGFLAPLVAAQAGVWLGGIRLSAEARAIYRWQIGADDFWQRNFGGSVGILLD